MEVGGCSKRESLPGGAGRWALVRSRREAHQRRLEGREFVEKRLDTLLFGRDLTPQEQSIYASRLSLAAADAQALEQGPEVGNLQSAVIPREDLRCKVGGVTWKVAPFTERSIEISPDQRRIQERLAVAWRDCRELDPRAQRTTVHSVGVSVDHGFFQTSAHGTDRVELSGWGLELLFASDPERTWIGTLPTTQGIGFQPVRASTISR